jgi:hypothetical protein
MFKNLLMAVFIFIISQNNVLASECPKNYIEVYDMLQSWSKSLNKEVVLDINSEHNYCVNFEPELKPKNYTELEQAISSLNLLFDKKRLMPLQVYFLPDNILITTLINTVKK